MFSEARFIQPVGQGFQPGIDAVTGLMDAVIGGAAEEMIELGIDLMESKLEIKLGHGQLVLIGEEDAAGCLQFGDFIVSVL